MNGLIILVSMAFISYYTFTKTKSKITKYILTPIIGVLYGLMLFFIGMGISEALYIILAVLPVIVVIFHVIKMKNAK